MAFNSRADRSSRLRPAGLASRCVPSAIVLKRFRGSRPSTRKFTAANATSPTCKKRARGCHRPGAAAATPSGSARVSFRRQRDHQKRGADDKRSKREEPPTCRRSAVCKSDTTVEPLSSMAPAHSDTTTVSSAAPGDVPAKIVPVGEGSAGRACVGVFDDGEDRRPGRALQHHLRRARVRGEHSLQASSTRVRGVRLGVFHPLWRAWAKFRWRGLGGPAPRAAGCRPCRRRTVP